MQGCGGLLVVCALRSAGRMGGSCANAGICGRDVLCGARERGWEKGGGGGRLAVPAGRVLESGCLDYVFVGDCVFPVGPHFN